VKCLKFKLQLYILYNLTRTRKTTFVFGTDRWWSNPLHCLGIG